MAKLHALDVLVQYGLLNGLEIGVQRATAG